MNPQKGLANIKSRLSTLDKINSSNFQNNIKNKKLSKHKENYPNKLYPTEHSISTNIPKKEYFYDFNNFFTNKNINLNNNNIIHNKISLKK